MIPPPAAQVLAPKPAGTAQQRWKPKAAAPRRVLHQMAIDDRCFSCYSRRPLAVLLNAHMLQMLMAPTCAADTLCMYMNLGNLFRTVMAMRTRR